MICFRDMTFCSGDGCAKLLECPRALTEEVRVRAQATGLPIAQFTTPKALECHRKEGEERETSIEIQP